MSWVLYFLYSVLLIYLIYKVKFFRLEGLKRWMPSAFFIVKIVAGVALWAVYTFYYPNKKDADIWKYFDDSKIMYDALHAHPSDFFSMITGIGDGPSIDATYYHQMDHWYQQFDNNLINDAHILIRFNALLRILSLGNYHTHSLIMCFLSFIGLCCMYKTIQPYVKQWKLLPALFIFLTPSLIFWGSGVLKEGLMLLGLGGMMYHAFRYLNDGKTFRILLAILCALLLYETKFYVLIALLPAFTGAIWVKYFPRRAFFKFGMVLIVFGSIGLTVKFIKPNYDPLKVLAWKQNDFLRLARGGTYLLSDSVVAVIESDKRDDLLKQNDTLYHIRKGADYYFWYFDPDFSDTIFVKNSNDPADYKILSDFPRAGSLMKTDFLQPNLLSFAKATPSSLLRSLFRPFLWEGKSPLLLLPALENLLLPALLLLVIFYRNKLPGNEMIGFCFLFSLLLLLVMGLTTPVLGALVRYRIAALPFLLTGILMLIDRTRLPKKLNWL